MNLGNRRTNLRSRLLRTQATALLLLGVLAPAIAQAQSAMRINEIQLVSGDSPQGESLLTSVELYNTGPLTESVDAYGLTNGEGATIATLPDWNVPANAFLTVSFGAGMDDDDFGDGEGTFFTQGPDSGIFAFGEDECGLYPGDPAGVAIADYVGWSFTDTFTGGAAYADAVATGIWTFGGFVNLAGYGQLSTLGRTPDGFDNDEPADWREYDWGIYQTTGSGSGPENPLQVSPPNGALLEETDPELRWAALSSVTAYELDVDDDSDFSSPEISISTTDTSYTVTADLPDGEYFWRVRVRDGDGVLLEEHAVWSFVKVWEVGLRGGAVTFEFVPDFSREIQHKDTQLLCTWNQCLKRGDIDTRPGCSETAGANGPWDAAHPTTAAHVPKCEHCSWYCSRASIQMVNNRYGGTLSQDRISYRMFNGLRAHPEGDLGHNCGTFLSQRHAAYAWALNLEQSQVVRTAGKPSWATVTSEVDAGRPIYIDGANHATVLHGYIEYTLPFGVLRVVVIANPWPGTPEKINYAVWKPDGAGWARGAYFTLPAGAISGLTQEASVTADSDGDAVRDFDEDSRFQASSAEADSDADQINDKNEIRNYTFHDTYHVGHNNNALTFADSDADGLRAEADCDSDTPLDGPGDGEFDGGEDIDGDGHSPETGETCPFDSTSSELSVNVDKDVYFVGEPVYIVDWHGTRESHTFHANSTYAYAIEPGCLPREPGAPLASTGTFNTDANGHAARTLVSECPEPGTFLLTVDILDDGVYREPECNDPQDCWVCQQLLRDCVQTSEPDTTFSAAEWKQGSTVVATTFADGITPEPGEVTYDSAGTELVPDTWEWSVDHVVGGLPVQTDVVVQNLSRSDRVSVELVISSLFAGVDLTLLVDVAADSYEIRDAEMMTVAAGTWSQYPTDLDPGLGFQASGIGRRNFRTCGTCPGDVDGSGDVTVADAPGSTANLLSDLPDPCADVNLDGIVNGLDVQVQTDRMLDDGGSGTLCPLDPVGACCLTGLGCQEAFTAAGCTGADGAYQGDGTVCDDVTCPDPTGACCVDFTCVEPATAASCADEGGAYQGEGTRCVDIPCPTGACCFPDGQCTDSTAEACGGTFVPQESCAEVTCRGACCFPDGGCSDDLSQAQCEAEGGSLYGISSTCEDTVCLIFGACCFADGQCNHVPESECGGTYQGDGTICAEVECPGGTGACCLPDGICTGPVQQSDCDGTYQGDGTDCLDISCPGLSGACCPDASPCYETTEADCPGTFEVALTCAEAECAQNRVFWNIDADGDWNDGSNWSTGSPPQPGQFAIIDRPDADVTVTHAAGTNELATIQSTETIVVSGGTLATTDDGSNIDDMTIENSGTFDSPGDTTMSVLAMSNGTLSGTGDVTIINQMTWTGGTQTDNGTTNVGTNGVLNMSGTFNKTLRGGRTMNNGGTATMTDTGSLFLYEGSTFNNLTGADFDVQSDANFEYFSGPLGAFNNDGTFTKSGGPGTNQFEVGVRFNNNGSVEIQTGTIQAFGGGASSGLWSADPDASIEFGASDYTFNDGTSVSGEGTTTLISRTLFVNGTPVSVDNFNQDGGTVGGTGEFLINNSMNWTNGTHADEGTTTIGSNGVLNMSGGFNKTLLGGRTMDNSGTATHADNGALLITDGAIFNNLAGASYDLQSDADFQYFSGPFGTFNNDGTFTKSGGTGVTDFDIGLGFNNDGTVDVQSGTLRISGGGTTTRIIYSEDGRVVEINSSSTPFTVNPGGSLDGPGTYRTIGNGNLIFSEDVNLTIENVEIIGGTIDARGDNTFSVLSQSNGTLRGPGEVTVTEQMNWTGGTHRDEGTTTIAAEATLTIAGTFNKTLSGNRTINNAGDAGMSDDGSLFISSGAVFNNLDGATFDVQSDANFEYLSGPFGAFNNDGLFTKSGGTGTNQFEVGVVFNNDGTVDVQTGSLQLFGGGSGSGQWSLGAGTGVEFGASIYDLNDGTTIGGDGAASLISGTLNVNGPSVSVDNFNQTGGTVDGTGELFINNNMNWTNGTHTGDGTTTISTNGALSMSGTVNKTLQSGRTFNNRGDATFADDGSLFITSGAVFNNLSGASFDVQADGDFEFFSGAAGAFNNDGAFTKSGGTGTTRFDFGLAFNNDGSVALQTGTLQVDGGGTNTGAIDVESDAVVSFGSASTPYTLASGTEATGSGIWRTTGGTLGIDNGVTISIETFEANAGTVENDGTVTTSSLTIGGGSIGGDGEVTATNELNWNGGTMADGGTTAIPADGFFNIGGSSTKTLSGRTINNAGFTTLSDSGALRFADGAVFNNLSGATYDVQSDADFAFFSGAPGLFLNDGIFIKSGGTETTSFPAAIAFINTDRVLPQVGTLAFGGGYTQTAGSTILDGGGIDVGTQIADFQGGFFGGIGPVFGGVYLGAIGGPGLSPGTLEITGDYEQSSTGELNIELGGTVAGDEYDVLVIGGEATLDGTLNVTIIDGFSPQLGDTFEIVTFDSRVGDFATYTGLDLGGGLALQATLSDTSLTLTVVQR